MHACGLPALSGAPRSRLIARAGLYPIALHLPPFPRRSDHVHNLAGDASLQKLDGLDTSLFSRAPPKARPPTLILAFGAQGLAGRRACTPVRRAERFEGVLAALRAAAYHWHHARGRAASAVALEARCWMGCGTCWVPRRCIAAWAVL